MEEGAFKSLPFHFSTRPLSINAARFPGAAVCDVRLYMQGVSLRVMQAPHVEQHRQHRHLTALSYASASRRVLHFASPGLFFALPSLAPASFAHHLLWCYVELMARRAVMVILVAVAVVRAWQDMIIAYEDDDGDQMAIESDEDLRSA
eukprot:5736341-Pleurochrysis_carterae.AAC.1